MGLFCRSKSSIAVRPSSSELVPAAAASNKGANLQVFKFKELEVATRGFAKENLIAKANYSHGQQIFIGTLKDGRVVAVKRPSTSLWHDEDAFENEMQILSKIFSRRIVNLLGYSHDGRVKLLVVENMVNGSLHDCLHGSRKQKCEGISLSWPMRVQISLQVAKAIRALHSSWPPIAHRNIKSASVFLDRNVDARLGDFGLARTCVAAPVVEPPRRSSQLSSIPELDSEDERICRILPTLKSDAVQYSSARGRQNEAVDVKGHQHLDITARDVSTKTDVFSFGMLLLEIMSGRSAVSLNTDFTPFSLLDWALPLIKQGHAMAICDARMKDPELSTATVKHMAAIAVKCLQPSAPRRPSMDEVVQGLTAVSKLLPLTIWNTNFVAAPRSLSGTTLALKKPSLITNSFEDQDSGFCKAGSRLLRLPLMWTGFMRLRRKRRMFGIFAKKFQFTGSVRFTKLVGIDEARRKKKYQSKSIGQLKGAAEVSDEAVQQKLEQCHVQLLQQHTKTDQRKTCNLIVPDPAAPPTRFCNRPEISRHDLSGKHNFAKI